MPDEVHTGGTAQPTSAAGTSPSTTTDAPPVSGVPDGVQRRIDAVVAKEKLAQERAEAAEARARELEDKLKSESELAMEKYANERLEQFRKSQHEPLATSAEQMKTALESQVSVYRESIPEERRPESFASLPLVQQLDAYRTLAESLGTGNATLPPTGKSPSPPTPEAKARIAHSDVLKWGADPAVWKQHREDVLLAQREGRIDFDR